VSAAESREAFQQVVKALRDHLPWSYTDGPKPITPGCPLHNAVVCLQAFIGKLPAASCWRRLRSASESGDGDAYEEYDARCNAWLRAQLAEEPPAAPNAGPYAPGLFCWHRLVHAVPFLQWRLLNCLWGKGRVEEQDVIDAVYGEDADGQEGNLRRRQHSLNNWLREHKIPYQIVRPQPGHLELRYLSHRDK
jgi:hypothetical protein